MLDVQQRMVTSLEMLRAECPDGLIVVVSHADPIRSALAYYAGIPLDLCLRLEIGTGSLSALTINDYGARILCVNTTEGLLEL